jgi:geranylgeranylglycerol-phosphate geranylgeranyltransferase
VQATGRIAFLFASAAVVVSLLPIGAWTGPVYLGGILVVDAVILSSVAIALPCVSGECVRRRKTTTLLKGGMFAALVVFTAAAMLP